MADIHQISDTDYYVYCVLRFLDSACDELKPLNNPLTGFLTKKFSNILAEYTGCLRYLLIVSYKYFPNIKMYIFVFILVTWRLISPSMLSVYSS